MGTVWYRWVAPTDGGFAFEATGALVNAYRGTHLAALTSLDYRSDSHNPSVITFRAAAGEEFRFSVDSYSEATYQAQVTRTAPNDDFANRLTISRTNNAAVGRFLATREAGEPAASTNLTLNTLWWRWVAPETGGYHIQLENLFPPVSLALYSGIDLTNLNMIYSADNYPFSAIDFYAVAGTEFQVGVGAANEGIGPLQVRVDQHPPNDLFTNAVPLTLGSTFTSIIIGGSREPGEVVWFGEDTGTYWFSFVAPHTRTYYVSAADENNSHVDIGVFTGTNLSQLSPLALATNSYDSPSLLAFRATAGTEYKIALGVPAQLTYTPNETPLLVFSPLRVTVLPGHENDDFANPELLAGEYLIWTNTTVGATSEPGEPRFGTSIPEASIWAKWTAPSTATYRLVFLEGDVFEGTTFNSLTRVSQRRGSTFTEFPAEAGHTYYFRAVSGQANASAFEVRFGSAPENDTAATAITLTGTNVEVTGSMLVAAYDSSGTFGSLWWKWKAPQDGEITVWITNVLRTAQLQVYHGHQPTLNSNVSQVITSVISFPPRSPSGIILNTNRVVVAAGTDYYLAASSTTVTNVTLNLSFTPLPPIPSSWTIPLPGLFRSGATPWFSETNDFHSAPDALQVTRSSSEEGWIEATYYGPGTLSFWWKTSGQLGDTVTFSTLDSLTTKLQPTVLPVSATNWTLRSVDILRATNVVRWAAARQSGLKGATPAMAWLDDIQFTPKPASPPTFLAPRLSNDVLQLTLRPETGRIYSLEYSTNLLDWALWTNFTTSSGALRFFYLPVRSNAESIFIRGSAR